MLRKMLATSGLALLAFAGASWGQDRTAVIIAQTNYDEFYDIGDTERMINLESPLRARGFDVVLRKDARSAGIGQLAQTIEGAIDRGDQVLIILAGHVVNTERDAFLLTSDADEVSAFNVGQFGLSLGAVLEVAAEDSGSVAVIVAEPRRKISVSGAIELGPGTPEIPQGVTVVSGNAIDLDDLIIDALLREGMPIAEVQEEGGADVRVLGYVPKNRAFLPASAKRNDRTDGVTAAEVQAYLWSQAKANGSEGAITRFLDRFNNGPGVAEARRMLADMEKSPEEMARDAEIALKLTREERRAIQADLTLLGYGTNGVDGIFGAGTRAAVRRWQAAERYPLTGYLDKTQIDAIANSARVERALIERLDAEEWRLAERLDTEKAYKDYLAKYPKGLFSEVAEVRLARFEAERVAAEAEAEQAAWEAARKTNTLDAYQDFLKKYPNGANANRAKNRIKALQPATNDDADKEAARAVESRILSNPVARLLAERQLGTLGFRPGPIDGTIDQDTRGAIRRFQRSRDIEVTGFIDSVTLARLLAASN